VAARAVLGQFERRAELVRAGVLTAAEGDAAEHAGASLAKHLNADEQHLRAKGGSPRRIAMLRRRLERLGHECGFGHLGKVSAGPVEAWLVAQADAGVSAVTRNVYRESLVCFGNWRRQTRRLSQNPFLDLPRADVRGDRRHQRRALTEAELVRLIHVARLRPLAEYGRTIVATPPNRQRAKKSRSTWKRAPLAYQDLEAAVERARVSLTGNPALLAALEHQGQERSLVYRTLALTGLRRNELATLTVGQLELGGRAAVAILDAANEKNRRGSTIPIRADLAETLRAWLDAGLRGLQRDARRNHGPVPARLPAEAPLFYMPTGLNRIFDRDLAVAGIAKRDERGRVVDVHALRVTFGTHLAIAGVPLRTAQAAMRHSKPELTANVYTDPKLLDVAGALAALPSLSGASQPVAFGTSV
jgi:integrase